MEQDIAFEAMQRLEAEMGMDGLVFPLPVDKPIIVTLCGSTRFWKEFTDASLMFTLMDHVVLSVGAATASDTDHGITEAQKQRLDSLHLSKIMMADFVFVLNVDGYIGQSTAREIAFAKVVCNLPVFYHDRSRVPTRDHVMAKAHGKDLDTVDVPYKEHTFYPHDLGLLRTFGILPPGFVRTGHAPGHVQ